MKLVGAAKKKNIDLFVSRLEPTTTVDGVQEFVVEAFVNDGGAQIVSSQVKSTRLDTKFDTYASFRITVTISDIVFDHVLGVLNLANVWPKNALVCKFFSPKSHE